MNVTQDKPSVVQVTTQFNTGIDPAASSSMNAPDRIIHTEAFKAGAYNSSCLDAKPMGNDISLLPANAPAESWKDVGLVTDVLYRKRGVEGQLIAPRGDVQSMHFTRFKKDLHPVLKDMRYNDWERTLKQFDYQTQPDCTRLKVVMTRTATACDAGKCKMLQAKEFSQAGPNPYYSVIEQDSNYKPFAHLPDGLPRYEATPYVTAGMDTGGSSTTGVNSIKGGNTGIFPVPDFMKYSGEQKEVAAGPALINQAPMMPAK